MNAASLGPKVKTVVFVDLDTKRVLGFAPEGCKPVCPPGTRYEVKVPFDAMELDKWVDRYAGEQKSDAEQQNYRQFMREAPMRKAIQDALRARNNHLDPLNRDLNNAFLALQEQRYRRTLDLKIKMDTFLVAQAYDESTSGEDLAMMNPNLTLN